MEVLTFWSQLLSCFAFFILPKCIRNHHTEFEIERTILNKQKRALRSGRTGVRTGDEKDLHMEKLCF